MEDRVMAKMFARVDWNFMRKVEEVRFPLFCSNLVNSILAG